MLGVAVEKSKSSLLLSSSLFCVRQMVLRVGFKFRLATARVRTPRPSRLLLALLAGYGVSAMALPTGGQVAAGSVTIAAPSGSALDITQTTAKGIINWQSFNVGSGEKVNFLQPSATSSTLNRVIGSDPSSIFGQINANGQVFLINNSGILFGPGAQVNAAGLVASTLQLADSDFLAGNYSLSGAGGSVDNQGVLKAGFVALAGAQVTNTGTIVADGGSVALAAGDRVTLNLIGSDLVSMSVDAPTATALVHAGGIVQADGGQVLITAKAADALLGTVVNVDGIVQAHSIGSRNGVITLDGGASGVVNVGGTLDASGKGAGQSGGTVKVTGADVGLFGHATIDASGDAGGGVVRVGGDWHGAGADGDANASQVFMGRNASIRANALGNGDGGNVVLWSDDRTQFYGAIDVRGGAASGNGGNVETSSHHVLGAAGIVDASARHGSGGTWLLDPDSITIETNGGLGTSTTDFDGVSVFSNDTLIASILDPLDLGFVLTAGTSVVVQTNLGNGGITVNGAVTSSLANGETGSLTLNAGHDIHFTSAGSITSIAGSTLNVALNAGNGGTVSGAIQMDTGSSVNTRGGDFTATADGAVHLSKLTVGGDLTVHSNGGAVDQETGAGAGLTVTGATKITAGAAAITLNNTGNLLTGDVSFSNSGNHDVVLKNAQNTSFGASTLGSGTFTVVASGDISQTGGITQAANAGPVSIDTGANNINLGHGANDFTGVVTLIATGNGVTTLRDANSVTLGTIQVGAGANTFAVGASAGDTLTRTTAITTGSPISLDIGGHPVDNSVRDFFTTGSADSVALATTATAAVNVTATGASVLPALIVSGDLSVTATPGSNITQSGALSVTGLSSFDAGTHDITLITGGNDLGGAVTVTGGVVAISQAAALTAHLSSVGSATLTSTGHVLTVDGGTTTTLSANGVGVVFGSGATTVGTDLTANSGAGTITQTGSLGVTGTSGLNAGAQNITLTTSGNDLGGAVTATGGVVTISQAAALTAHLSTVGSAALTSTGDVLTVDGGTTTTLSANGVGVVFGSGATTVGSDLTANSGTGTITQTASLGVTGTSGLNAGTHNITLTTSGNDLGGTVTATGGVVTISQAAALTAHLSSVGSATLTSTANGLTVDGGTTGALSANGIGVVFGGGATTVGGNLTANSGTGTITQTGSLGVTGTSGLNAGTQNITLTTVGDDLGGAVTATGGVVTISQAAALTAHLSTVGSAALTSTANSVTVDGSTTGALSASGNGVALGTGATALGVGTALTVHSGTGSITQGNTVAVGTTSLLDAGSNNVTLGTTANTFGGVVTATGTSVTVAATNALDVNATLTGATGNLNLSATGALTGPTAVTTAGDITLSSGAAFATGGALSGNNVSLTGTSVSVGHDVTAAAGLTLHSTAGAITQTAGAITAHGASTLTAAGGGNSITLNDANDFVGLVTASGAAIGLTDTNALNVHLAAATTATLNATGALTVDGSTSSDLSATGNGVAFGPGVTTVQGALTANAGAGAISQAGKLAVTNGSTLTAGGTLTLADATNTFGGAVAATGSSIDIAANGNLNVTPTLGAGGSLTLAANGSGTLTIPAGAINTIGDVSLTAGGGLSTNGDITAHNVTLGGGALSIGNHIVATGTFTATSTSTISETGAGDVHATGTATLNAGANAITLGAATNNFGTVSVTGGTVTIVDADALTAHLTSTTSASLTAGGTGSLTVDGSTTAGNLTLVGDGIVFGGGATSVHGNLDANSGAGTITQTGTLSVTGTSALNAGSSPITLTAAGNDFGGLVSASGTAIALTDTNALTAHVAAGGGTTLIAGGLLTVDGSAPNLVVTGNGIVFGATTTGGLQANGGTGTITQTGALTLANSATLSTAGQDITLTNAANHLGPNPTSFTGANVALTSATALLAGGTATGNLTLNGAAVTLGNTTVGGALNVTGNGGISATGPIQVTGASTLNAGASDITLSGAGNHFGGLVTATGGAVALTDTAAMGVHLASAASANLVATGALAVDGATTGNLAASGSSVTLGSGSTTVGGALTATAATGDITQSGTVAVTGASTLTASAGAISLANPNNDFGALVTASAGGAVHLADVNALSAHLGGGTSATLAAGGILSVDGSTSGALQAAGNGVVFGPGTTTVGGALTAHSGTGTITQTGAVAVTGASTLDAGGNAITLATAANDFGGAVTATGSTVSLADANALTAHLASTGDATLAAAGLLTLDGTSAGGLSATGTGVVFGTGATHVTGALVANSGSGTITQSGALGVGGASTLNAGTNAITLATAGNDFTGLVSATGGAVSLADANALAVHLASASSATLNAGGVLTVDGATSGALGANGNGVVFGATTVGGNLAAAGGTGTLTQTGALVVSGTSTLGAGSNAITLSSTSNDFGGAVTATGGAVSLADANALTAHVTAASATLNAGGALGVDGSTSGALSATGAGIAFGPAATTVHGALTATSSGAITQSGDLAVTGATTISAAGQSVTLARQTNQLAGGVTVAAASADIEQAGALAAHLNSVGTAVVKSGAALAVDGSSTGDVTANGATITFGSGATAVGGKLAATSSAGDITQSGTLAVTGASTLNAGAGNVTLANAGNALAGGVTASGGNVTLVDASPLTAHLAANGSATLTSAGALSVDGSAAALTATGVGITQASTLAVTGLSQFNAGTGDILLDAPGTNLQGAVTATGHVIHLTDAHAIDATVNATSDVVLSSTSDVQAKGTFGGGLKVTGAKVSLDQGASGPALVVGGLFDVTSTGDTALGNVTANGTQVTAGGTVLLDGKLTSSGNLSLKGQAIQGVKTFGALDVAAGSSVTLAASSGNIGNTKGVLKVIDDQAIIQLLGVTGQSGLSVNFNQGQSAWFRVSSQTQTPKLLVNQFDFLRSQTYFCDTQVCVNLRGETTAIADSVIANILSAASQDAADAAFGTENLDFAIRKGYVTTIGRVPPGIDEIAGDLGATQCDSRVTSPTAIAADKACSAGK